MRVRDHVLISAAGAALAAPFIGHRALALWAGGVLIDTDHYAWFCVRQRRVSTPAGRAGRHRPARTSGGSRCCCRPTGSRT
jgi:hypothetical protein